MEDEDGGRLALYLSAHQQEALARYLRELRAVGHGEVRIRVVKGEAKFIAVTYETPLYRYPEPSTITR